MTFKAHLKFTGKYCLVLQLEEVLQFDLDRNTSGYLPALLQHTWELTHSPLERGEQQRICLFPHTLLGAPVLMGKNKKGYEKHLRHPWPCFPSDIWYLLFPVVPYDDAFAPTAKIFPLYFLKQFLTFCLLLSLWCDDLSVLWEIVAQWKHNMAKNIIKIIISLNFSACWI